MQIRIGNITVSFWDNEGQNGTVYNVTVSRSYKDGDQWTDTNSFNRDDLLVVAKLSDQAHTWVFEQEQADRQQAAA